MDVQRDAASRSGIPEVGQRSGTAFRQPDVSEQ
jgi:hypothetical protein